VLFQEKNPFKNALGAFKKAPFSLTDGQLFPILLKQKGFSDQFHTGAAAE
jgi:hypothetical protein